MAVMDLTQLAWTWQGWRPNSWRMRASMETGFAIGYDHGPYPARLPGTVQQALRDAGELPDWLVGRNSLACEWVEHYQWELVTKLDAAAVAGARSIVLEADGLDYSGWILLDGREVGSWRGALVPQRMDLTAVLSDGGEHWLSIVFDLPPPEQGQIGFTSQSRFFKPRYNYSWDWCPRFVPIGVVGGLRLRSDLDAEVRLGTVRCQLNDDLKTGGGVVTIECGPQLPDMTRAIVTLLDGERPLARTAGFLTPGLNRIPLLGAKVEPWFPNLHGAQRLYELRVELEGTSWSASRRVGFKHVAWRPCDGAPDGALPWICVVNRVPVFLQGVNWSPIRVAYPDTTADEYRRRVALYRDMGCTILRVWGGAYLPPPAFFDACDEAGLLVWQEFPLSSSGIDNWPPEDPDVIDELCDIALSYIERRAHHACLLMWCGGNELQSSGPDSKTGGGVPCDLSHPCLAALDQVVRVEDPGRRFLPTSGYGPQFSASLQTIGTGRHHLVHGPWGIGGALDLSGWYELFERDDSLFRAETGMPGACDVALIQRYLPDAWWPPTNATWRHSCAWWLMLHRFAHLLEQPAEQALAAYVEQTQREQAEALAFAARRHKERFPACGGFIIWHGHDCWPCPINNSLIDVDGRPKPVVEALRKVFTA